MRAVLAIDTSTAAIGVAIGVDGRLRGEVRLVGGRRHAEQLAPAIATLGRETRVELADLSAIAVGIGPGLFTGLRVGVTTAMMLAQALRVPVVPVPSLDLIAYPLRHTTRLVVAAIDARRHEVFHARYRPVPGGVQRVSDYAVGSPADVVADLEALDEEVLLAGDGATRYAAELAGIEHAERAGPSFDTPSPSALAELADVRLEREEFVAPGRVRPMYLRASDADIAWDRSAR